MGLMFYGVGAVQFDGAMRSPSLYFVHRPAVRLYIYLLFMTGSRPV